MEEKLKKLMDLIKADNLGQIEDDTGGNYLPKPIADKVIEEITEANILRKIFPTITVPKNARSLTVPSILFGSSLNVYKVSYGTEITPDSLNETTIDTSRPVVLTPQLLVTFVDIIEDDLETAGIDLARAIRKALTLKLAEAEEKAMLTGASSAGTSYSTIFDGLCTIASGASCANSPVTYNNSDDLVDKIADARKELGVYGSNPADLVLICSLTFGNRLRKEDKVANASYNPSSDLLKTGSLPPIMGIKVFETSYLDGTESGEVALLVRKDAFLLGVRKDIFVREKDITEKFSKRIILAEEIDFKPAFVNTSDKVEGLIKIHYSS